MSRDRVSGRVHAANLGHEAIPAKRDATPLFWLPSPRRIVGEPDSNLDFADQRQCGIGIRITVFNGF